jgi:hypothetical protein
VLLSETLAESLLRRSAWRRPGPARDSADSLSRCVLLAHWQGGGGTALLRNYSVRAKLKQCVENVEGWKHAKPACPPSLAPVLPDLR